jgi:hypothetical protein
LKHAQLSRQIERKRRLLTEQPEHIRLFCHPNSNSSAWFAGA